MRDKQDILEDVHGTKIRGEADLLAISSLLRALLEVHIDIRDELTALITILPSVEKIAYRAG